MAVVMIDASVSAVIVALIAVTVPLMQVVVVASAIGVVGAELVVVASAIGVTAQLVVVAAQVVVVVLSPFLVAVTAYKRAHNSWVLESYFFDSFTRYIANTIVALKVPSALLFRLVN